MREEIERFLRTSKGDLLKAYIGPRVRNRIWDDAARTYLSEEEQKSHVTKEYWNGRVKPTLRMLLEKLYYNRGDLLPDVSKEQIYSIASVVKKSLEESRREIEPITNILEVGRELIPENKIIISPAEALVYGIRKNGEMVDFYLLDEKNREILYSRVRREVEIEDFDGSVKFGVKLNGESIKLIFGLNNVPSGEIRGEYKIRKITGMKGKRTPETVE
jgi:hypothetical protein